MIAFVSSYKNITEFYYETTIRINQQQQQRQEVWKNIERKTFTLLRSQSSETIVQKTIFANKQLAINFSNMPAGKHAHKQRKKKRR